MKKPAASPPNAAPPTELALARAANRTTAIGASGLPLRRPRILARRLRPLTASAAASSSMAGAAVHGSGGSEENVERTISHATSAHTAATTSSVHGRVGVMLCCPLVSGAPSTRSCWDPQPAVAEPPEAVGPGRREQIGDPAVAGDRGVRVHVVPRGEHERPLVGARVRQRELGVAAD